ncbi:filamentous hemagglutinin N-terminal domain-containing protein [Nitrincola schmidtii]|uniref:two-partner secretion domain-containing protein n=1 Tax=Nitrincola schmidtii TaxID=1730894 RepID=UPI00124CCB34|nr:filamentous hemagglutinin N-terminal domain-containing protein [Nitrincola schmidtii]
MNKFYRTVWNSAKGVWQVAGEIGSSKGKQKSMRLMRPVIIGAGSLILISTQALASDLPTNGTVVGGNASISTSGHNMTIHQSTDKLAIDWQSFSIGDKNQVEFVQPSSSSAALNRVTGDQVSTIRGALKSNGQVFLVNPNGVLFSSTAQVDVGALVASTLDISTEDFMQGNYTFSGTSANAVINQGNIKADGGYVAMIAAQIINAGSITADEGTVLMGAGSRVTLDLGGPVKIEVKEALLDTYIEQGGAIKADGGLVFLTAKAAGELTSSVINHTGITEAQTLASGQNGEIFLMGDMESGVIQVAGVLDASAPNVGNGGFIETSAANVQIQPELKVTTRSENGLTGKWLIDPTDFTISSGVASQTDSGIGATTLQSNLADSDIEIQTVSTGGDRGNINVNADVTWNENTLTLTAHGDILINSTLTAAGSAELVLNHGWNGNAVSPTYGNDNSHLIVHGRVDLSETSVNTLAINGANHTILRNQSEVAGITNDLDGRYVLGGNLDFTGNWTPIGVFTGHFNGLGNQIHDLVVSHNASGAGLFGSTDGATLSNLRLAGVNITNSGGGVGALVGNATNTNVNNVHVNGVVTSTRAADTAADAGGLVGFQVGGSIRFSSANVNVIANGRNVGGLVGDATNSASIENSFALGSVETSGNQGNIGGLVGALRNASSISNSYATGNVVGQLNNTGNTGVGGLVGEIRNIDATVSNSYSSGLVTTTGTGDRKGGLVGANFQNDGTNVTDSYWVNGLDSSAGGLRITTNENSLSTYSGFGDSWTSLDGYFTPFLRAQGSEALMLNQNLVIESANDLILNQNFNSISVVGESTLTLKAQRDIVFVPERSVVSSGGSLNLVLWADTDGNDSGGILFDTGSNINTRNGHLWMGGGAGSSIWKGLTVGNSYAANLNTSIADSNVNETYAGINVIGAALDAGSGDLYMSGKSFQTDYRFGIGTRFNGGNTITANNISIHGIGSANTATGDDTNRGNWGVGIENTTMNATGDITVNGQGGGQSAGSNGGQNHGIRMDANSHLIASGAGNITLIGSGGGNASITANTDNDGIRLDGGKLTTANGSITLQGTAGLHGSSEGVSLNSGNVNNLIQSTEGGDITIVADTLDLSSNQRISSSGNLVINPNTTANTIGIGGASGTLSLDSSYFSTNFVNGFSNIIIGSDTAGNIAVGGDTIFNDNLTLKTANDIVLESSSSMMGSLNENASLTVWSDADGSGAGSIYLMDSSTITTNGGHLWMGGGNGTINWNGLSVGDGYAMAGSAHAVTLGSSLNYLNGISISNSNISTGGGNISLSGMSANQSSTAQGYIGILFDKSSIDSGDGNIEIRAISNNSSATASWYYGLLMTTYLNNQTSSIASSSGNISINGETSFQEQNHGAGIGLYGWNNNNSLVEIRSNSGDINITGRLNSSGFDQQYGGIFLFGSSQENIVSQTGNISLSGLSANSNVAGINVWPGNTTSSIGYDGVNPFTGDITLNSNTFINFEGSITANTLNLLGAGVDYTLESIQNNVNILTANTGSVSFTNSDALELVSITASSKINVATQVGNLIVNGNISSDSSDNDAILLNAARSALAGTANGGNIIHQNGSITTANGGRALLYTGSVNGSTGVTDLVGSGSGNFRYNSNATTTNFTTALGQEGIFAIYREQPTITVSARNDNKTVSATPYSGGNGIDISGLVNGDAESVLTGALVYGGNSQGAIEEGMYVLTPSGLDNGLGYDIAFVDGTLQIMPEPTPEPTPVPAPEPTEDTTQQPIPEGSLEEVIASIPKSSQPFLQGIQFFNNTSLTIPNTAAQGGTGQVGSLEVIELESSDLGSLAMLGNGNATGFLRMFVIDGGINVEGQSRQGGSSDESSTPEILN